MPSNTQHDEAHDAPDDDAHDAPKHEAQPASGRTTYRALTLVDNVLESGKQNGSILDGLTRDQVEELAEAWLITDPPNMTEAERRLWTAIRKKK